MAAYHSCCAINLRRCCQVSEHCIVPELSSETKRTPSGQNVQRYYVVSRVWNVGHLETTEHNYSCEFLNRKRILFFTKYSRFSKDYKYMIVFGFRNSAGCDETQEPATYQKLKNDNVINLSRFLATQQ